MAYSSDMVALNVGRVIYTTSVSTLITDPDSMLGVMFSGKFSTQRDITSSMPMVKCSEEHAGTAEELRQIRSSAGRS